jgi:hypothetical protein
VPSVTEAASAVASATHGKISVVILARLSRVGACSSRLTAAHAAVNVLDIQGAQSLRKSRWNGEERGSAFLPLWLWDSADL